MAQAPLFRGPGTTNTPSAWTNAVKNVVADRLVKLNGFGTNTTLYNPTFQDTAGETVVTFDGDNDLLRVTGNIWADQFSGNGAGLTNIPGVTTGALTNNETRSVTLTTNLEVGGTIIGSRVNGNTTVAVFQHDPTISGTVGTNVNQVGGYTFGQIYQPVLWDNGPAGFENYVGDTWHFGVNVGTQAGGVGRADTNKPNFSISFESQFYNVGAGVFGQEFNLQGIASNGITDFRPLSFFVAHDVSLVGGQIKADYFNISDKAGNPFVSINDTANAMDLNGVQLRFASNNVPAIQQMNAAGSGQVNMLYLDAGDVATMSAPLYVIANRAGAAAPFPGAFAVFQPNTANANDTWMLLVGPTLAGAYNGVVARAIAGGLFQQEFNNQGAGDSQVLVTVEGAGDPSLKVEVNGGGRFTLGIDNTDSDKFKISTGAALGSGDIVTIDSSGNVGIGATVAATNGFIVSSNSYTAQPTLVGGDTWYASSNGRPHVVWIDFSGTRHTNDLTGSGGAFDFALGYGTITVTQLNVGTLTLTNNPFVLKAGDTMTGTLTNQAQLRLADAGLQFDSNASSLGIAKNATDSMNFNAGGAYRMRLGSGGLLMNSDVIMAAFTINSIGIASFGDDTSQLTQNGGELQALGGFKATGKITAATSLAGLTTFSTNGYYGRSNVVFHMPTNAPVGDQVVTASGTSGASRWATASGITLPLTVDTVLGTNGSNAGGLARSLSYLTNYNGLGWTALMWRTASTDAYIYADDNGEVHVNSGGSKLVADQNFEVTGASTLGQTTIGGGATIVSILSATASLNFGNILAAASADLTITVTGARANDTVQLGPPAGLETTVAALGLVTADDTVTVRLFNVGTIAVDPASATWRATVTHY